MGMNPDTPKMMVRLLKKYKDPTFSWIGPIANVTQP